MQYYFPFAPVLREGLCDFLPSEWNITEDIKKSWNRSDFINDFILK